MRKLLSGLVIFFVSMGSALADASWMSGKITPVASHTDLSVAYLAQVFGTVGTSLQGTSGQMLGMLFSKLNEGILVVAGLWLVYTVITIALRSAMDGSFMGPNKNVFWIIIRIALAFAMLIPGPMTGYNVIQDIVMKVVVEGVSLADQTWNFGLDYISAGGSLWHNPSASQGSKGKAGFGGAIVSQKQGYTILKTAQEVFLDEVCMIKSSTIGQTQGTQNSGGGVANTNAAPIQYNIVENKARHGFYFPGMGNSANYSSNLSVAHPGVAAQCGSVGWNNLGKASNLCSSDGMSCMLSKAAVSQMVYDMLPAAQKFVCSQGDGGSACVGTNSSNIVADNGSTFFNTLVNYVNAVMPIAQGQAQGAAKMAEDFIPSAEKEGWMMAGRYYWDLSQIQGYELNVGDLSKYLPGVAKSAGYQGNAQVNRAVSDAKSQISAYIGGTGTTKAEDLPKDSALGLLANYSKASGAGNTGASYPHAAGSLGNWVMNMMLGPIYGDVVGLLTLFSTHAGPMGMGTDPILFLHNIGMKCLSITGDILFGLGLAIFGAAAATMGCQSTLNLDTPLQAVSDWIKPPLMVLAAGLLGVGVLLGYYVPLYPFMLFTFGVIGWIICVIEAMVAAPLIAFGLTHPEGHDFLGEAKQGLMLLLGVFLRPVLMVIGLIAGMILSYVSLRILVYSYSGFLQDLFYNVAPIPGSSGSVMLSAAKVTANVAAGTGGSLGGLIMTLFCFPMLLAIFAALVYVVTNQCFSLIYVLPDYILRWIGGPQSTSAVNPAQMAGQVQGAMGQMGHQAAQGAQQGHQAMEQGAKERERDGEGASGQGNKSQHNVAPTNSGTPPA